MARMTPETIIIGLYVLAAAYLMSLLKRRPRWWVRLWLRRDLRALAHYRRNLRRYAEAAEQAWRDGDLTVGRELAVIALMLDDCDRDIDATLDQLDRHR